MKENKEVMVVKKVDRGDKYFPADFLAKLYEEVNVVRDKTYIMFHCETGLRVTDVVNAEWVHIDRPNLRIYCYDHKKNKWRYIYFPKKVLSQLDQWQKQCQIEEIKSKKIFPFSEKTASRIIKKWCKELNFPFSDHVGTHWCRHTFVRLSRKMGRDMKYVQQNTGDTVKTVLEWYSELSREDMRRESEKSFT